MQMSNSVLHLCLQAFLNTLWCVMLPVFLKKYLEGKYIVIEQEEEVQFVTFFSKVE